MTSIDEGKEGQLELPASTIAKLAPPSSQPAFGNGYDASGEKGGCSPIIASAGSPPSISDLAMDCDSGTADSAVDWNSGGPGSVEQPAINTAIPNTHNANRLPMT